MADLKTLKGVGEKDRKLIEDAESLLGPEPSKMGFVKNMFWGNVRQDLVFPYPVCTPDETARCDELLARLNHYLKTEHPAIPIDQDQEIPRWVIDRLFELGVLGMTIPREFGGGSFGITSYNRVLERIGQSCGSTAVMVSAHQSIGCKAVMLFGNEEQKKRWLPHLAKDWLSAFCLSEPNVGCDAGGQETRCELSPDGQHYILNGEKKWSTSGALSGLFTVMAKQQVIDPKRGKPVEKVTALVCTPDMEGIDIFQKNRSKCGIRGTWQARIRFNNVKVPRANLLHQEGRGLNVALTCLNYGRCTLSAGMLGGARRAFAQSTEWAQTRFQFQRPLADFELVQEKIARMAAYTYAMDAVLYMTTGMLDRHDEDIMVETAICKLFCSEMGWRCVNDAMQIMGGEGYMTENEIERIFRDSRINLIVEGANEVMQSFIFAYGGKQLAEQMLGVQQAVGWDHEESPTQNLSRILHNLMRPEVRHAALPLGSELFLGHRPHPPEVNGVHDSLRLRAAALGRAVAEHSHQFKLASKHYGEQIISRQAVQARVADSAMWLHAWTCTLSKLDHDLKAHASGTFDKLSAGTLDKLSAGTVDKLSAGTVAKLSPRFDRDKAAAFHFMEMAESEIRRCHHDLFRNDDESMKVAAQAALRYSDTLPNEEYAIPEASPIAKGTGRRPPQAGIKQFPGDGTYRGNGHGTDEPPVENPRTAALREEVKRPVSG